MIPAFSDGVNLPLGGHSCSLAELEARFVCNDHRRLLFDTLLELMRLAKRFGFLHALLGGSFPTAKERPSDLDVTWFCKPGTDKTTVSLECIELMEDSSDRGNFLYVPFDEGSVPDEWPDKMHFWATQLGFDLKTGIDRGVLLVNLKEDDDRLN